MLERVWRKGNPPTLLVGMQTSTATMENSGEIPLKIANSLLFNRLSRLVIPFLSRTKPLLISWLQSPSTVILEPKTIKSLSVSTVSPSIFHEVMRPDAMILVFWMLSFKPECSLSSFTVIKKLFSSSLLSAIRVVSSVYLRLLILFPAILIPACASNQRISWCTLHIC